MNNIAKLPNTGYCNTNKDLASNLRHLANEIENNNYGPDVRLIISLIEDSEGKLHKEVYGGYCDYARAAGVLSLALIREI